MGYIKKITNGNSTVYYYFCVKEKINGRWTEKIIRPATKAEVIVSNEARSKDIALVTCANPDCDNVIRMARSQKRRFNTTYPLRYKRFQMVYCSEACQQAHEQDLGR